MKKFLILFLLITFCGDDESIQEDSVIETEETIMTYDKTYNSKPEFTIDTSKQYTAEIKTSSGDMIVELFTDTAPNTVNNFISLSQDGYYNNVIFHRVIKDFMIQGGDILSRDGNASNDGTGSPGWTIDAEFNDIKHSRGILSMARSSNPNSAGSQFFICVSDQPHLDGKYTAFGKVTEKIGIIDHIVNTPTEKKYTIEIGQDSIPDTENKDNWIRLVQPRTKKPMFYKK